MPHEYGAAGSSAGFAGDFKSVENFKKPSSFFLPADGDKPTYYHGLLANAFREQYDVSADRLMAAVDYFEKSKTLQLNVPMKPFTLEVSDHILSSSTFSALCRYGPHSTSLRPWTTSLKLAESQPTCGMASFYAFTHGSAVFIMFPINQICDYGYPIDHSPSYLNNIDVGVLDKKRRRCLPFK